MQRGKLYFSRDSSRERFVLSRGDKDFGWGPIFEPSGYKQTFGEMEREDKHAVSMRSVAIRKLADFLSQK